jgi:hypothetical protein
LQAGYFRSLDAAVRRRYRKEDAALMGLRRNVA